MLTEEQELTFENINEFFSIAEEIVDVVSESINKLDQKELMYRLDVIESFIEQMLSYSEIVTDDYTKLISGKEIGEEICKEEIKQQIVLMIVTLNNCKEELLLRLKDDG